MGFYINPHDMKKEHWLLQHGEMVHTPDHKLPPRPEGKHYVCLVDNGDFSAAGIAFDQREADVFIRPDGREKVWFAVPDEDLVRVCPSVEKVLGE